MGERWLKVFFVAYTAFVVIVSLIPAEGIPTYPFLDKIVHFIMYFIMALLALMAFQLPRQRILSLVFTFSLGLILEWLQGSVDHRTMSAEDLLANILGASAGIVTYFLLKKVSAIRSSRRAD